MELTLDVTQSHGEVGKLRYLSQDLLGDQVDSAVLWPQVDLALEPGRTNLQSYLSTRRRCHNIALCGCPLTPSSAAPASFLPTLVPMHVILFCCCRWHLQTHPALLTHWPFFWAEHRTPEHGIELGRRWISFLEQNTLLALRQFAISLRFRRYTISIALYPFWGCCCCSWSCVVYPFTA